MHANRELAQVDALKSEEIESLRSKKNVYILNPWNNILVGQLRQKNKKLITSESQARQEAVNAKNEAQAALKTSKALTQENKVLVKENEEIKAEAAEIARQNQELKARISVQQMSYVRSLKINPQQIA